MTTPFFSITCNFQKRHTPIDNNQVRNTSMQQNALSQMGDGLSVEQIKTLVESCVYERDGVKFIRLGNYALDFKAEFVYLGLTKTGKVNLGDVHTSGPNGLLEYNKKVGFIEVRENHVIENGKSIVKGKQVRLWTMGYRYSETLGVIEN